jgi:hypothetical protein
MYLNSAPAVHTVCNSMGQAGPKDCELDAAIVGIIIVPVFNK